MLNEYKDGGLKMLDIQSFNCALKAKWVQKYLDDSNQAKWKLFFDYFIKEHDGKLLLTGNLNQADVAGLNIQDTFTKEVIEIWSSLNYEENLTDFGNTPIWYNSLIRIANQPIFYRKWSRVGVNQAKDILDHKSDFLKYEDFESRYKVKTTLRTNVLWCCVRHGKIEKVFSRSGYDEFQPTHLWPKVTIGFKYLQRSLQINR